MSRNNHLGKVRRGQVLGYGPGELDSLQGFWQRSTKRAGALDYLAKVAPTDADIDAAMTNICRCGTYNRVRAAIHLAAGQVQRKQIPIVIEGGRA